MKKMFAAALMCATSLTNACASDIAARAAALTKASPDKKFLLVEVPSAGNFISNKLIIASLKAGTESTVVADLLTMLQRPEPMNIAVTGDNDGVTAATLGRAFDSLKGKTVTPQEVAYIGSKESEAALSAKAAGIGLKLIVVPFP